jgi:hypothetical protein
MRLGYILYKLGNEKEGSKVIENHKENILRKLKNKNDQFYYSEYYDLAICYSALGDKKEAIKWLKFAQEKEEEGGFFGTSFLLHDPLLDNVREDVEFKKILAKELDEDKKRIDIFIKELSKMQKNGIIRNFDDFL